MSKRNSARNAKKKPSPEVKIPVMDPERKQEGFFSRLLKSDPRHILTTGFLSGFVCCSALISLAALFLFGNVSLSPNQNQSQSEAVSDSSVQTADSSQSLNQNNQNTDSSAGSDISSNSDLSAGSAVSSGDKYLRTDLLWTGRQGYLLGNYLPAYAMNLRMEPLTDADEAGQVNALETINIVEITEGLEESVWGRTDKGPWILLQDKETLYCYGPGEYQAIDPLAILNGANEEVSHFRSQQRFFADQIFTQSGAIYGILSDGNQVILWNQVSTVDR